MTAHEHDSAAGAVAGQLDISALAATQNLAVALAADAQMLRGKVMYLQGDLGAGKTALIRYLLRALGETATIKSPTYGLLETYQVPADGPKPMQVLHLDLYRLEDAEELEYLGLRDQFDADTLMLVEWPERGVGVLPTADMTIHIHVDAEHRWAVITPAPFRQAVEHRLDSLKNVIRKIHKEY